MTTNQIIEITTNFSSSTTLTNNFTYVINGEIHVLEGVTLNIEFNTLIMIKNGIYKNSTIFRSALIFDTGSTLYASDVYLTSCNSNNISEPFADNGGLWFVGSASFVEKDGIFCKYSPYSSSFNANKIYIYYLGSADPIVENKNKNKNKNKPSADQDGITLLGCAPFECNILGIYVENSGDNAIDVVESHITINDIEVIHPGEDAINIQSGQLEVINNLRLYVPLTNVYDRDIFDFETNNGFSYMRIAQHCYVDIVGIFGDQLNLTSNDLPQPNGNNLYYYKGVTTRGDTYIWTRNVD
jgi:hypothetical protein